MSDPTGTTTDTLPPTPGDNQHPGFRDHSLAPTSKDLDDLLAQYFEFDPAKVDRERRTLLKGSAS